MICILRAPGTNCDIETKFCIETFGIKAKIVHINRFLEGKEKLSSYLGLVIPGGFSYGDRVRSGAILAKILSEKLKNDIKDFIKDEKPILGICNGFQVLVESGLLPFSKKLSVSIALGENDSARFEDRWVYLKNVNKGKCIYTKGVDVAYIPVAHKEGKIILPIEKNKKFLKELIDNDQIVFRYAKENGKPAEGQYPYNPNGSFYDIAGICNENGTVFGLMPHPERAFLGIHYPDWRLRNREFGDGYVIFKNMIEYIKKRGF